MYRKPTHTDRYLSYDSHHPVQHKAAVVRSLMDRASNLPSSNSDRKLEARQVIKTLESNNYPKRFILRSVTNSKCRSQRDTTVKKLCGFTTIPYIGGVSEPIKKILNQHNIQVALKPYKTIGSMFPKPKDPVSTQDTRGVIYKISCNECSKTYIGESKRKFKTRIKEHKKAVAQLEAHKSALAEHHKVSGHDIAWDEARILGTCDNWRKRRFLEAWQINKTNNAINRDDGLKLPREYLSIVLKDKKQDANFNQILL